MFYCDSFYVHGAAEGNPSPFRFCRHRICCRLQSSLFRGEWNIVFVEWGKRTNELTSFHCRLVFLLHNFYYESKSESREATRIGNIYWTNPRETNDAIHELDIQEPDVQARWQNKSVVHTYKWIVQRRITRHHSISQFTHFPCHLSEGEKFREWSFWHMRHTINNNELIVLQHENTQWRWMPLKSSAAQNCVTLKYIPSKDIVLCPEEPSGRALLVGIIFRRYNTTKCENCVEYESNYLNIPGHTIPREFNTFQRGARQMKNEVVVLWKETQRILCSHTKDTKWG